MAPEAFIDAVLESVMLLLCRYELMPESAIEPTGVAVFVVVTAPAAVTVRLSPEVNVPSLRAWLSLFIWMAPVPVPFTAFILLAAEVRTALPPERLTVSPPDVVNVPDEFWVIAVPDVTALVRLADAVDNVPSNVMLPDAAPPAVRWTDVVPWSVALLLRRMLPAVVVRL
jgi:hypothetical protein